MIVLWFITSKYDRWVLIGAQTDIRMNTVHSIRGLFEGKHPRNFIFMGLFWNFGGHFYFYFICVITNLRILSKISGGYFRKKVPLYIYYWGLFLPFQGQITWCPSLKQSVLYLGLGLCIEFCPCLEHSVVHCLGCGMNRLYLMWPFWNKSKVWMALNLRAPTSCVSILHKHTT